MSTNLKDCQNVCVTQDGRELQKNNTTKRVVWLSGYPINEVFSCGFLYQVFCLVSEPITVEQIANITDSSSARVLLALNDLKASGVDLGVFSNGT